MPGGAEVRRGAVVRDVTRATWPTVVVAQNGQVETISARLLVGADGRVSSMRKWSGFRVRRDPDRRRIAGVLFEDMPAPEEALITASATFVDFE